MPAGDNITLNAVSVPGGDVSRFIQKGGSSGPKTQVILIDKSGTGTESLVTDLNPFPVNIQNTPAVTVSGTVTSVPQPKTPFTFRQQLTSTKTNFALVTPGGAFRLTSFSIQNKSGASLTPDQPSILVGVAVSTTPTNSQVIYANSQLLIGTEHHIAITDLVAGGASDSLLITTGTFTVDVIEVFGTGYLV